LCERYGISRQTGHLLYRRYRAESVKGLEERSRAPKRHGRAMCAEAAVQLIELRKKKPFWGPKKLLAILRQADPAAAWPAASSVSDLLRRGWLSEPRRRRRRALTLDQPFAAVEAPNDAWCIDFKGWFRTQDGRRCDPFTVTDAFSRMLLGVKVMSPTTAPVQAKMDQLFREHGSRGPSAATTARPSLPLARAG
jgi:transposase InsO family protein